MASTPKNHRVPTIWTDVPIKVDENFERTKVLEQERELTCIHGGYKRRKEMCENIVFSIFDTRDMPPIGNGQYIATNDQAKVMNP
jgi:hypothetical protein